MSIFCFFGQFFFYSVNCCFLAFFARFYFMAYLKRDDLDNLEMYQAGACCRLTVTGITVLHMLNLFM